MLTDKNNRKSVFFSEFIKKEESKTTKIYLYDNFLVKKNKEKFIEIESKNVWEIKKILFNKFRVGVSKQRIYFKDKIFENRENIASHYPYVILKTTST